MIADLTGIYKDDFIFELSYTKTKIEKLVFETVKLEEKVKEKRKKNHQKSQKEKIVRIAFQNVSLRHALLTDFLLFAKITIGDEKCCATGDRNRCFGHQVD